MASTYIQPGEALAAAGQGSARPGLLASGSWAFQQPPLTLHLPRCPLGWGGCEDLGIGRGFPSGSGKEGAGKVTAIQ